MNPIDDQATEVRTPFSQQVDPIGYGLSLVDSQRRPPLLGLISDLDIPHFFTAATV